MGFHPISVAIFPLICIPAGKHVFLWQNNWIMTNYNKRYNTLNTHFKQGVDCHLEEPGIDIRFFRFHSLSSDEKGGTVQLADNNIIENFSFEYPVFTPSGKFRQDKAILLLHGLNERNWDKYLPWAEFLCLHTGKPVILFPIAFHINRALVTWSKSDLLILCYHI